MKENDVTMNQRILAYDERSNPFIVMDKAYHRLEIRHGTNKVLIQFPVGTKIYIFSGEAQAGIDYGKPIAYQRGRVALSFRQANKPVETDDIFIVRRANRNYYLLIPRGTLFQVTVESSL